MKKSIIFLCICLVVVAVALFYIGSELTKVRKIEEVKMAMQSAKEEQNKIAQNNYENREQIGFNSSRQKKA